MTDASVELTLYSDRAFSKWQAMSSWTWIYATIHLSAQVKFLLHRFKHPYAA